MRFTAATAALAALATGAVATQSEVTVMVTDYETYCPKSTPAPAPQYTTSNSVVYSVSKPLVTSTVTHCNKCSSTPAVSPVMSSPAVSPSSSSIVVSSSAKATSIPLVPSSGPSGVSPSGSATTPAAPIFTGGASRAAAGAGAGLATVFGLVAYLL